MLNLSIKAVIVLIAFIFNVTVANAEDYDIVINNGRVMDPETQYDQVSNVGIKGGKIAVITKEKIIGKDTIDANGLVVAPGFIDTHLHWPLPMGYKISLRDGVTTGFDLEIGALGTYIDQWYAERLSKTQMNYGTATSHELARSLVLDGMTGYQTIDLVKTRASTGWSVVQPDLKQGNEILSVIDEGLRAGALGIGSTLGYMREGVTAREMFEVQKLGGTYGRQTGVHFRTTPGTATQEVNGFQEVLANGMVLKAPVLACHFNNPGWRLVHELLSLARKQGYNVWGEIYPYNAGSTGINAVFLQPSIWIDQLGYKYEDTLLDPLTNKFYTLKTYSETVKNEPTKIVIVYKMPEEEIAKWLTLPGVSIAADSMPIPPFNQSWDTPYDELDNTHPRTSGTHAKALQIAREHNIPLMLTLSQLSYVSAKHLGDMGLESMQTRGRLQEGMVADITIFDPINVQAKSTYETGTTPSEGIPYVIVNGVIVVKDSKVLKDVYPGQPIRFKVENKGRHVPITLEDWNELHTVAPLDLGGTVIQEK